MSDSVAVAPVAAVDVESTTVTELLARLTVTDKRAAAVAEVAALIKKDGVAAFKTGGLLEKLKAAMEDTTAPAAREGALVAYANLCKEIGAPAEPALLSLLPVVLERFGDKAAPVRTAADAAGKALVALLNPLAVKLVLPTLFEAMDDKKNWQTKVGALNIISGLSKTSTKHVGLGLPDIMPAVTPCMNDAKEQVKAAAYAALTDACLCVGNRDVEPFVPTLVSCIARPQEVSECIHKLSATTFVQAVESPCLAMLTPLLVRGLRERQTAIKRKTAVIIDNMAKLVENPADAHVFLPRLLPGLERMADEVSDPEARSVAAKAHTTLVRIGGDVKADESVVNHKTSDPKAVLSVLKEVIAANTKARPSDKEEDSLAYVASLASALIDIRNFEDDEWNDQVVSPYLESFLGKADTAAVVKALVKRCFKEAEDVAAGAESDEEGEELCNCEFQLAYGGKILLNNATLRLKRGKRYGLCGPNGAGKSTLMRAISNGQLDGFPPKDVLRTVYVEHDIDASMSDVPVVDFVFLDKDLQATEAPPKDVVSKMLGSVGFDDGMQAAPVASLSGGWKMKLALARAMLMKPDIMLLDEPTNHLDVINVAWLENHLVSLANVTSIVVSHDSGFLDNVCTSIIHYEGRKLRTYKGNLSEFVKVRPEAKSYYELAASTTKFVFPEPGFLEGIKTKDKAILKMVQCGFTYPGTTRQILSGVTIQCSLNSRVAVVGKNGAGKSTMIKLLTGEMEPQEGTVWKHPNMRVAYVAQHAFHHIEQHLDKTPNQYIQWRYAIGEDREGLEKVSRTVTAEEEAKMQQKIMHDGVKKVIEKLVGRRKLKKSYEYEVQWVGMHPENNTWMSRDDLTDLGFGKLMNEIDVKEAARQGLHSRPLTQAVIQKHLEDVGLEAEFGTHSQIRGLSGGQKVKLVLGAAMWNQPHILVLDEPTNYLDRDSLGALAGAIREYGGGVVMITHHEEFSKALCPETWVVENGKLDAQGHAWFTQTKEKLEWKQAEETLDAFGNVVKIKQQEKKLSNKEKKAKEKLKKARRDRGEEVSDSEEEW